MLINCPECNKEISDKAFACPNCGFPINIKQSATVHKRASQNRYKKLPNGFGSIKHLSGNRRKPYACYPPTKEWVMVDGKAKAVVSKAIGYYATYNEAYLALAEYNKSPYDTNTKNATFKEVYDLYFAEKYGENGKEFSKSAKVNCEVAFNLCSNLHHRVFTKLNKDDLQRTLDGIEKSYSTVTSVKSLYKQLYNFAMAYDMGVTRNIGELVIIKKKNDIEKGVPFTEEDINLFWNDAENDIISRIILIMIYSGLRIAEAIEVSEIDTKQKAFIGGVKTKNGKDRVVPFNSRIEGFIPDLIKYRRNHKSSAFRVHFNKKLDQLGLTFCNGNTKHTPHDCRHTFSWLADKYEVNDFAKHLLMGHSLGNDVEKSVYGHRTFEELKKEIDKIK